MNEELRRWAEGVAHDQLRRLPKRWKHVQGVAEQAAAAAGFVDDGDMLVAAAWLHDVGYAPDLVKTGFHPVDGATFLRDIGVVERLCALVANHSCAHVEARHREIPLEWTDERTPLRDALWWADMTTTATGERTDLESRIVDVERRYGRDHVVTQSVREAEPELAEAIRRTESLVVFR
ncbi:HD domain-containing protein [Nocardia sp. NEAU-G5]|uniref:HD domain-containing protein n=1 Tax=Nocardia albiluteola TaxID=2842303 RepID=A0ABS6B802_9NOCA|nr:HD domain-containing protein [Nocardia albiluteola]MBU3066437.1 HD domain-containing protein [Nocardia albiluteola]